MIVYDSVLRAIEPSKKPESEADFQAWFERHQNYRWNQAKKLTEKLVAGDITPSEWHEAVDALLLEGHANAWWIGRELAGKEGEFTDKDLLKGRGYKDVEAQYLASFLSDIEDGRYTDDETGDLRSGLIDSRIRLYIGKFRGTVNDAFVKESPDEAEFYWRLGAAEEHCSECPELAHIFNPSKKEHLFTTPGAGDTPCLGNCLCHIERVVKGESLDGVKPVGLELPEYEQENAA